MSPNFKEFGDRPRSGSEFSKQPLALLRWRHCRAIAWRRFVAIEMVSTAFGSIGNGESVFVGYLPILARLTSKSSTITEGMRMARTPIHPGEILADELTELGVTASEAARILRVPANRLSLILRRKRAISADTALRLGHWLGTGPELWMNLQTIYDLDLARKGVARALRRIPCRAPSDRKAA
jgi:addiction module HigA family antidote